MATSRLVKASVLHGKGCLRLEDRRLEPPAADEVQVAIQSTGLCGSDLHYFHHHRNGNFAVREPLTLGHESSGIVVAVGSSVSSLLPGHRVALEVGLPCERCEFCRKSRYNICPSLRFRSSAKSFPHVQGTLQQIINHPARWCHPLPEKLSLDLGALVEPLSVAVHARNRASMSPDSTVLVFGAGAIGLLTAAVCKACPTISSAVVIADVRKDRLDFALTHGFADAVFVAPAPRPDSPDGKLAFAQATAEKIKSIEVKGRPLGDISALFECTGVETCLQTCIYAAAPGSKIIIIGMGNPIQTLPISAAALREVDLIGVFRYANTYTEAIDLLSNRPPSMPDPSALITHRFKGMGMVQEAFAMAGRDVDDEARLVLKVIVDMREDQ